MQASKVFGYFPFFFWVKNGARARNYFFLNKKNSLIPLIYSLFSVFFKTISQEEGWVVCRVFKKKYHRGFQLTEAATASDHQEEEDDQTLPKDHQHPMMTMASSLGGIKQVMHRNILNSLPYNSNPLYDGHLPQLFSPEAVIPNVNSHDSNNLNSNNDILERSHNLLRLTTSSGSILHQQERAPSFGMNSLYGPSDWSFLDKLLGSHPNHHDVAQSDQSKPSPASVLYPSCCKGVLDGASDTTAQPPLPPPQSLFPFQFHGCNSSADLFKFSK